MTNTDTRDVKSTLKQINNLYEQGCELVRLAILNPDAAEAIKEIKKQSPLPLIADIHFDYRLAIRCIENGIDALRINPGNILYGNGLRHGAVHGRSGGNVHAGSGNLHRT